MKKRDVMKQKRKLKKYGEFKMAKFAQYMCIAMVLLFLAYFGLLATQTKGGMKELLSTNLFITTGFIVCVVNLYVFYTLKRLLGNLENFEYIEATRMEMLIIAIAQLLLFNYASAALLIYCLIKYFKWQGFHIKEAFREIKKTKQLSNVLVTAGLLVFMGILAFVIGIAAVRS